ncbi:hypothetical protein JI721_12150 [Alicyclobacillus cycloheptanicus]|uniref:ABC-type multidrug transport system fused ATPase/permease subunit n=1 Tax=Alicyclobacillus cycloheptanicus TaxID=1457 RepID=A0ABT9XNE4_9BACL|nr:hypothetical protein [Alicyclobacillus cycloheptanicus]MDQ0191253.1 ABC-type multidrug transport system fused ATPase/permease subunit [Alicyclobacillus cycloheptanicus]WDM00468.1 hypothetical protein JI721_12150 [Alicyclobacillus cycloheptanicus]
MSDKHKIVSSLFLVISSLFIGWLYAKLVSNVDFAASVAVLLLSGLLYTFLSSMASFLLMVIEIFAVGVLAVFFTWFRHVSMIDQWRWIEVHGLFSLLSVLVWFMVFSIM